MALQLTGAFKEEALANLQLELPAVVIGGGLTAIDTATELLAYYPIQAEKTLARYAMLCAEKGEDAVRATFDAEERDILDRLLAHGLAVHKERERAHAAGEIPDLARLCREWGGVAIAYRRTMEDSPAYRLNHEEIIKALEEGISFIEGLEPPGSGARRAREARRRCASCAGGSGETVELPARTCLVAAGTTPNITYAKEYPGRVPARRQATLLRAPQGRALGRGLPARAGRTPRTRPRSSRATPRRQVRDVLRRQPPRLQRQRREGHGLGAQRLRRDRPRPRRRGPRRRRCPIPSGTSSPAASGPTSRRRCVAVNRLTPTIVEVVVKAPGGRRATSSRASSSGSRTSSLSRPGSRARLSSSSPAR